ncbi:hypothetical protein CT690_15910 [Serratia plymuthica]|uniref:Uncharacterized protein n=1 Tax=Serratia plymuthica TaxID=82996 RepID=A0A318NWQ3_SERPL|nr:hypothetical protein [Serratia plymuthica]PYD38361.1 hypothetical protein CT690_15910 [Serratia plymuthica]
MRQPKRFTLHRAMREYSYLVAKTKQSRHPTLSQLNSRRLQAAQYVIALALIQGKADIWRWLADEASTAPAEIPFSFSTTDAWMMMLDIQHIISFGGEV